MSTRSPDEHQYAQRREVGDRIRYLRRQQGVSQERLGELVGVDRRTIGSWENGVTAPTLDDLTAVARAFGIAIWRLFYG